MMNKVKGICRHFGMSITLILCACVSVSGDKYADGLVETDESAQVSLDGILRPVPGEFRPYTVEDMLRMEDIRNVRFGGGGDTLIFERFGPRADATDFGRPFMPGGSRSKLYAADLAKDALPRRLFKQNDHDSYTLDSLSPDGREAFYNVVSSETGLRKGIVRFGESQGVLLGINPDYSRLPETPWVNGRLAIPVLADGHVAKAVGLRAERREKVADNWRAQRGGALATASAIGSGRFKQFRDRGDRLVWADPRTDEPQTLAAGVFLVRVPSPDGLALAGLRRDRLDLAGDQAIDNGANARGVKRALLVFDFDGDNVPSAVEPCEACDVLKSSLRWSSDGRLLSFVARKEDAPWAEAAYHVYDRRSGGARIVDTGAYVPFPKRGMAWLDIRSAWLGEALAVFVAPRSAPGLENGAAPRPDWFLVTEDGLRNLTAGFDGVAPELIAITEETLIMIHKGDAWAVDAFGGKLNLTQSVETPVREWRAPFALDGPTRGDTVLLQTTSADDAGGKALLFVDPEGGLIDRVEAGSTNAHIVAASPASRRIAFIERDSGATRLLVSDPGVAVQEIVEINTHLRDVAGGTPVRIDHQGPDGDDRMSWVLMPLGWQEGDLPVPTIVDVYPDRVRGKRFRSSLLDLAQSGSDHLLAARGYAVLFPSLPAQRDEIPRDPIDGLVDEVFSAVDAAIAMGLVDSDRLGVTGISFGGYATGALVGLTDRFKAAVAQAGLYNLTSSYGIFDIRFRLENEYDGLDFFGAGWSETGQGRLGAPVWRDPERYWRNSPLAHVENISTPIMLTHGDYDYVSVTQAEELFTALSRLDKDAMFVRYWGEGHNISSPANIRDMWRRIFDWYDMHLGEASMLGPGGLPDDEVPISAPRQ